MLTLSKDAEEKTRIMYVLSFGRYQVFLLYTVQCGVINQSGLADVRSD
jgi:hypothetical protein